MPNFPAAACVHILSLQSFFFVRIEWTSGWSIFIRKVVIPFIRKVVIPFIRKVVIPLILLSGLLWSGSTGHLAAILKQLLN